MSQTRDSQKVQSQKVQSQKCDTDIAHGAPALNSTKKIFQILNLVYKQKKYMQHFASIHFKNKMIYNLGVLILSKAANPTNQFHMYTPCV